MTRPFGEQPERGDKRFTSPVEELEFLRAQVAEKERQINERGHKPHTEEIADATLHEYKQIPTHEVIHDSHTMSDSEVSLIAEELDLLPDTDDEVIEELLGVLQEKGVKNSLNVAGKMNSPHIEDDFHRALVQYVAKGHDLPDLRERTPLWNLLNMTLFEVTLPEPTKEEADRPFKEIVSVMEQFY